MRGGRAMGWVIGTLTAALLTAGPAWAGPTVTGQAQARARAAAAALPGPVPCNTSAGSCWQPPLATTWQYQLQGSVNSSGQCIYPGTGFINTAVTGTSFATGRQVAPKDIGAKAAQSASIPSDRRGSKAPLRLRSGNDRDRPTVGVRSQYAHSRDRLLAYVPWIAETRRTNPPEALAEGRGQVNLPIPEHAN